LINLNPGGSLMSDFLNDALFQNMRDYIYGESGIHFSESNRSILESRLKERLRSLETETPARYLDLLKNDKEETRYFLDAITTNLTRFFRNQAHYDTFINYVIPDLVNYKKSGEHRIRIWSAGCSTGEEPYTNAMVLSEHLPPGWEIEVIASDLSLKSLMKAKEGFYPAARVTGIPETYLHKYFDAKNDGYQVKDNIRSLVRFDYHNLKFDSSLKDLDIVFCRNVLIYFDEAAQKNVISHFWNAMASHSFLFIGHSESLFGMDTKFEFIKTDWACLYGKIRG
jgi:chemotaxis protein methyltransferase CheR